MEIQICLYAVLFFFFFLQFGVPFSSLAQHLCHPHERLALLQFKETFHTNTSNFISGYCIYLGQSSYPKISSWNKSSDCCSWDGITCHGMTGHVIGLDLSCSGLEGAISPNSSLFTLSHLQKLNLAFNDFKGSQISHGFGGFTRLTHLNLSSSLFNGQIPSEISHLSKLVLLDLSQFVVVPVRLGQHDFQLLLQNLTHLDFLSLFGVDISSEVPMNLSSSLSYLDLSVTGVHGKLPNNVYFQLPKLQMLRLFGNKDLTGSLPQFNCSKSPLQMLDLSGTNFFGELANSISCLKSLRVLRLRNSHFFGHLPESIGNLSKLISLDLSFNNFIGWIPANISKLLNLVELDLSSNKLSGIIEPDMFSNLKELVSLDLSDNMLIWKIKNDVTLSFPNLTYLGLSSCGLKEVPELLRNSKNIGFLQLSNNDIRRIPTWFTSMPWDLLNHLNLSHNSLSTMLPLPFKNLAFLDFRSNQLQGPLPLSICNLERLQILNFSNNKLTDAIPPCFANFSGKLFVLDLNNNSLQGKIALTFATDYCSLEFLGLNGNLLEGPLPRSLSNCERLEVLDVGNNNISDTFPTWLENLKMLQVLILKSNRFFGSIGTLKTKNPFEMLRVVDISSNEFVGVVPTRILKSFRAMESMNTNESKAIFMEAFNYTGYYQASVQLAMKGQEIVFTKILTTLTSIDMSNNRFSGEIPKVIGNLVSLKILNLSHNRFYGHIPSTLGNLSSLESLDISCNYIGGEIPWQLTLITSLSFLNLSQNHLEGHIPHGSQFNTFSNDSYIGNLGLCGFPLTRSCGEIEAPPPLPQLIHQQEEDSDFFSGFTWKPVILGYGCGIVFGLAAGSLMFLTDKPKSIIGFIEKEIYYYGLLLLSKKQVYKRFKRPTRRGHKLKQNGGAHH